MCKPSNDTNNNNNKAAPMNHQEEEEANNNVRRRRSKRDHQPLNTQKTTSKKYKLEKSREKLKGKHGAAAQGLDIAAILPSLGLVVVAVFAVLAKKGFRGRISVAGIDLGTTNSVICIQSLSSGVGEIECIKDPYSNSNLIPSVVSFYSESRYDVGVAAKERIESHPHSTIFHAKRFMGYDFDDEAVQDQRSEYLFHVVPDGSIQNDDVKSLAPTTGVKFQVPSIDVAANTSNNSDSTNSFTLAPEQIGSYVVKHMIGLVDSYLGYSNLKSAVIAVPAKFNSMQRAATGRAFQLAGMKVARVLEEPVAAALAYGLHRKPNIDHILVYDFGGGTLDVSVLHVSDGFVDVMASEGDDRLGGADFDAAVAHFLEAHSKYKRRIVNTEELFSTLNLDTEEYLAEHCKVANKAHSHVPLCHSTSLHLLGERIKIKLSSSDTATEQCLALTEGWSNTSNSNNEGTELCEALTPIDLVMTRSEYDEAVKSLYEQAVKPIYDVLDDLDLTPEDIDEVVMVGGTSRMPAIREVVKRALKVDYLNTSIDPDITVAYGCASVID